MVRSRTVTAIAGIVASLLVSAAAWYLFDTALFFLLVPFVPFLFRRKAGRDASTSDVSTCPVCGFRTRNMTFEYCPRDGTELE